MLKNGDLYDKMGLTKEEIALAGTHDRAGAYRKRVKDNLAALDSYLSLLYYRGGDPKRLDMGTRMEIEKTIRDCRELQKELDGR